MVKMAENVIEFVKRTRPALVATVSPDGSPNVAPKESLTVLDDEHLVYADLVAGSTSKNIDANPLVAVLVMDNEGRGYQIKGQGKRDGGGRAYQQVCEVASALRIALPPPQAVVIITVQEVTSIAPVRTGTR